MGGPAGRDAFPGVLTIHGAARETAGQLGARSPGATTHAAEGPEQRHLPRLPWALVLGEGEGMFISLPGSYFVKSAQDLEGTSQLLYMGQITKSLSGHVTISTPIRPRPQVRVCGLRGAPHRTSAVTDTALHGTAAPRSQQNYPRQDLSLIHI